MDFIDLKTQYARIQDQVQARIQAVFEHGRFIMGPEVQELEQRLAEQVGVKHCIGVSSGTDALLVAMMALDIGPGDEVITTPFTFIATGEMIALLGAKPVFVDIDERTYNIDPEKIEDAITDKTRAIMPVSLYGQCADMDRINEIAGRHGLPVIEDAAQSLGATYNGRQSCALSTIGCTSFFPSKPLGGYGDSGACFTDDDDLARVMREIRVHGQDRRYHHPRIGINGRLDTLQAASLLPKLDIFAEEVVLRAERGERYTRLIQERCPDIVPPYIAEGNTSVYAQYTILVENREAVQQQMQAADIPTAVHYPVPLNRQPALSTDEFDLQVAERLSEKVISLPMHPYLSEADQERVVAVLAQAGSQG
jgi:UDP-2-acetamido-2-deoxy-ribo-hexuluronate aminotransferase